MDKAEIEAMRAHLAACYPPVATDAPRKSAARRWPRFRRAPAIPPQQPPCPRPVPAPLDLVERERPPASATEPAALREVILSDALAPRRDAFGQRCEPVIALLDLWEPLWAPLEARRAAPPDADQPTAQAPFFPGDLDDVPAAAPPARLSPSRSLAPPAPSSDPVIILSTLAARLGREQRLIARKLAMAPRPANDDARVPAIAFRAAIR